MATACLNKTLNDGESIEVQGSAAKPYIIKNIGGVISCSCASWRNTSAPIERRSCKHCRYVFGDKAEELRIGSKLPAPAPEKKATAPPLLLANTWTTSTNPAGWIMSEKLDGTRAYWNGDNFISRLGNLYHAPDWFKAEMPACTLDGELFLGRKQFQRCVSIVRRQDKNDDWKDIQYVVFDAPLTAGMFVQRVEYLKEILEAWKLKNKRVPRYWAVLDQEPCKDIKHLYRKLKEIEARGGEGLMLRQPDSLYEVGRSSTLLKVKTKLDGEAIVVGHEPGKGKHKGRLGALVVLTDDGIEFSVGTGFSDAERSDPPKIGTKITFRYQELSNTGVPRFPSYLRVREE